MEARGNGTMCPVKGSTLVKDLDGPLVIEGKAEKARTGARRLIQELLPCSLYFLRNICLLISH